MKTYEQGLHNIMIFISLSLFMFLFAVDAYALSIKEQDAINVKNEINEIAVELARCQGIIKAHEEEFGKSKGIMSNSYSGAEWLLSFIKKDVKMFPFAKKKLDIIEDKTYKGTKLLIEAGSLKAVEKIINICLIDGVSRRNTFLMLLKKSLYCLPRVKGECK